VPPTVPAMLPLDDISVVDFSTLLPGPLATLALAQAGARVTKIERPGGEDMRFFPPLQDGVSLLWQRLNAGKEIRELDLKDGSTADEVWALIRSADVLVEQFRPGVMDRLGYGWEAVRAVNPRIVYVSITGYGSGGPDAGKAGHDLIYCAETGLLALAAGSDGAPVVPAALVADIAGGSWPAVINLLLALRRRDRSGQGCRLDVAMTEGLQPFLFWAHAEMDAGRPPPAPAGALLSGGSPRYRCYRTADGRWLAVGALEDRFWQRFTDLIGLVESKADDGADPDAVTAHVAALIAARTAGDWESRLADEDVCCAIVRQPDEVDRPGDRIALPLARELTRDRLPFPAPGQAS